MIRAILSVLFLIFNIPNSLCACEDTLREDSSPLELALLDQVAFQYKSNLCPEESCTAMANKYSEKCSVSWFHSRPFSKILNCEWLGEIEACILPRSKHYYRWIKSSVLGILGQEYDSCPPGGQRKIVSKEYILGRSYSTCHCNRLQYSWKIHLGELRSRELDNYVIAGIRFKLRNQILFLQLAEGKLEATGRLSNISWVPLPDHLYEYRSVTMNSRTFFFDDLKLAPGYALTGIKFDGVDRGTANDIMGWAITIRGVPFDATGRLDLRPGYHMIARASGSTIWNQLVFPRKNPIYSKMANNTYPSSKKYNYVRLERSELSDDFGQSTLPLFDSTPISFKYAPLAGVGIFHKGSEHHAGYITLRIHPVE